MDTESFLAYLNGKGLLMEDCTLLEGNQHTSIDYTVLLPWARVPITAIIIYYYYFVSIQ